MFAQNLKKLRIELGLSVSKFADRLEMSANTLTNYEQNRRAPSLNLFVQLDKKVNANLNWLVSGKGEMFNQSTKKPTENDNLEQKIVEVMEKYGVIKNKA